MSNLIEAAPEEPGNGSGGTNRAFVLVALGLASLLVVGLLLIFGYVAGSRLGFFGSRALATPDASAFVSGGAGAGTATAVALAGATSAAAGTRLPAAATSAAAGATAVGGGTRVAGATVAGSATAAGTSVAGAVATANVATATPTRVVGGSVSTLAAAATNSSAANTLAPGAVTPSRSPGGAISGGTAEATATPSGPGTASSLPGTGVELDILIMGILMVILLVLARGFRMTLRR